MGYQSKIFWLRHSQKFAAVGFLASSLAVYFAQPYYAVFVRWGHLQISEDGKEVRPNARVNRIAKQAFDKLKISSSVTDKIDIFLTTSAESIALGGVISEAEKKGAYAFIGLPFFANYATEDEIPLRELRFSSPTFPYSMHSSVGKERISLMHLSDAALEFLIARETVNLLGSKRILSIQHPQNSRFSYPNPKLTSCVSSMSMLSTVYASYQVCYFLNRALSIRTSWMLPFRLLSYLGVTSVMLLCQRQLLNAWRQQIAFAVDRAVGVMSPDLRMGGIEYYSWKLNWNAFWSQRLPACRRAFSLLGDISRGASRGAVELPPLLKHQYQVALKDPTILGRSQSDYYFIPASVESMHNHVDALRVDEYSLDVLRSQGIPAYQANTLFGNEKFAADGQSLHLNLNGFLAFGIFPSWLATFFGLLSNPATCSQRKLKLEQDVLTS